MIFTEPIPFDEALDSARVKTILPTFASTASLRAIAPALRERAFFSARTTNAWYLQQADNLIAELLHPAAGERLNPAEVRTRLKEALAAIDYQPDPAKRGGLQDLSSDTRLNLIIDTQEKMAAGYGNWKQAQDPAVLDQWPAQELYRAEERNQPRAWHVRWDAARGQLGAATTALDGRIAMAALKNDPIWETISAFGLPYPPFDFNSGMDVRDVDRDQAIALGLIDRDNQVPPQDRGFNQDLETSSPVERQGRLFQALLDSIPEAQFINGVLRLKEPA